MRKLLYIVLAVCLTCFVACGEVKETPQKKTQDEPNVNAGADMVVSGINGQIKDFSIDGFPGGSSNLNKSESLTKMKGIVQQLKPIIEKVPDGYILEIRGHCANFPPENLYQSVSDGRAKRIYQALINDGVPASKISWKGLGVTEPLTGVDDKDPSQRRVSFKTIKK